jgi:hypothetical protein
VVCASGAVGLPTQRKYDDADGFSGHAKDYIVGRNDTVCIGKQIFRILQGWVAQ